MTVDLSKVRDKGVRNPGSDRTAITFSPDAGILGGVVFWPGTQDEAMNAIADAAYERAFLRVPAMDGGNGVLLSPYALDRVSSIITIEYVELVQNEENGSRN